MTARALTFASKTGNILSPLALLASAYGLYFYLRYKIPSMILVLDAYLGFLNVMCLHAAYLSLIVAVFYLAMRWAAWRWPMVNRCFPLVGVAVIIVLIKMFSSNLLPPLTDVGWLTTGVFKNVWDCLKNWLATFINLMSLGIVFAYWFISPGAGKMVSSGIMALLNLVIFLSLGLVLSAIPAIGQTSGVLQVCLNFIVLSDILILFGVTTLFKKLADYISERYFPLGRDRDKAACSAEPPAALSDSEPKLHDLV